jgi:hypothetical protein
MSSISDVQVQKQVVDHYAEVLGELVKDQKLIAAALRLYMFNPEEYKVGNVEYLANEISSKSTSRRKLKYAIMGIYFSIGTIESRANHNSNLPLVDSKENATDGGLNAN